MWGLFPTAWRVPQVLCLTFCKITKVGYQAVRVPDAACDAVIAVAAAVRLRGC